MSGPAIIRKYPLTRTLEVFFMKNHIGKILIALAVVLIATVGITGFAFAQSNNPPSWFGAMNGHGNGMGPGSTSGTPCAGTCGNGTRNGQVNENMLWGLGGPDHSLVAVAASTLNMERTALVTELQSGKTIAQVAQSKGIQVTKLVDAFLESRMTYLKEQVATKKITQLEADTLLATLRERVTERLQETWTFGMPGEDCENGCMIGAGHRGPHSENQ
jgi:hypothetical protein